MSEVKLIMHTSNAKKSVSQQALGMARGGELLTATAFEGEQIAMLSRGGLAALSTVLRAGSCLDQWHSMGMLVSLGDRGCQGNAGRCLYCSVIADQMVAHIQEYVNQRPRDFTGEVSLTLLSAPPVHKHAHAAAILLTVYKN